ncbi:solute carrier family 53 member 1 [Lepeophtheirus salmonis]|nr:xenotropic and polytropic retrovirus receptor 1 homolog [Lepeophtheirus salmonis]XP_040570424.1 xenotropic and polytropic retrovirus receptor 1 homolog [Lepeophtheirus salmonis]
MKFGENLGAHITPEWRKQYIQYEEMKDMLYGAQEEAPSAEIVELEVLTRFYANFDENFFTFCEKELAKINTFYSEKLAEATRKYATLCSELSAAQETFHKESKFFSFGGRKKSRLLPSRDGGLNGNKVPARKLQDLKLAFSEYYLSLVLLQNYQNLNYTGFRKILKKHDKMLSTHAGANWRIENVDVANFYINKDIDKLIQDTESKVTNDLEDGDRQKAMKRLRVPPLGDHHSPWTTFKVGLFSGAFIVLLITVIISGISKDYQSEQGRNDWRIVFRLYRGPLLVILFIFLMGVNVYGWRSSGVNHVLIFELDPRNHLSEQHLMEVAAIFGVIWTLSVLMFLYSSYLSIPAYVSPLALVVLMGAFLLNPTKTFRYQARFWLLRVLGRIATAPFFYVGFADFWIADQLNSLAPAITDLHYLICFYSSPNATIDGKWQVATDKFRCVDSTYWIRSILSCLPAWFRFAQCLRRYRDTKEAFPHLVNAGKYSTTFFVVTFSTLNSISDDSNGPFFYMWIVSSVCSSLYAYTWDIKMDWGLFDSNAGENRYLREEVVYSRKIYYYFGIVEDFVLRFGWAISLSLTEMGYVHGDLLTSILAPLEVFRRFVWNFFRLENEHLNNCGKFRAVRDISVTPMDASDQSQILKMMDESHGVMHVRRRKTGKKHYEPLKALVETSDDQSR